MDLPRLKGCNLMTTAKVKFSDESVNIRLKKRVLRVTGRLTNGKNVTLGAVPAMQNLCPVMVPLAAGFPG
jgi:hypothetical protein